VGRYGDLLTIVMELVDGVSLRTWLAARPRTTREVLGLFAQIGQGLAAAHRAGVVHRDMKPENILVAQDDRARVTDFGVALTSAPTEEPAHAVAGTLLYMAPEQLLGKRVDARADQFAFAVTLHEALVGARPFAGTTPTTLLEAMDRGLPARGPRSTSTRVWRAMGRALARDPSQRFPSMDALVDALLPRATKLGRTTLGVVACVALVVGGYGLVRERRLAHEAVCKHAGDKLAGTWDGAQRRELDRAFGAHASLPFAEAAKKTVATSLDAYARAWEEARIDVCEATRVRGEQSEALMDERMACLDDRRRELGSLVGELVKPTPKVIEKSVEAAAGLSPIDECKTQRPLQGGGTLHAVGPGVEAARDALARMRAKVDLGDMQTAAADLEQALPAWKELGDTRLVGEGELLLGVALSWGDDFSKAEKTLLEASWSAESVGDDLSVARASLRLAHVAGNLMANQSLGEHYERQAEATLTRMGKPPELEAELLVSHAMRIGRAADYDGARALAQQALDLLTLHDKGETALAASCWNTLSVARRKSGDTPGARLAIERAITIREALVGPTHPLVAHSLVNLSTIELDEARFEEAAATLERALSSLEATTGPVTADAAMILNNLGIARARLHDTQEAQKNFERAAEIGAQVFGDHPSTALYVMNLGDLDRELGRPKDAISHYARASSILDRSKSSDAHTRARILAGRGHAELDVGDAKLAKVTVSQALTLYEHGSFDPADRADANFAMARVLSSLHEDPARATGLASSAREVYAKNPRAHQEELSAVDAWLAENEAAAVSTRTARSRSERASR
jgi:eukaryotic-like serine/threonine-protein kinase